MTFLGLVTFPVCALMGRDEPSLILSCTGLDGPEYRRSRISSHLCNRTDHPGPRHGHAHRRRQLVEHASLQSFWLTVLIPSLIVAPTSMA